MISSPIAPGFYSSSNKALVAAAAHDCGEIAERWQDEASDAALAGNPAKASYIEFMVRRLGK